MPLFKVYCSQKVGDIRILKMHKLEKIPNPSKMARISQNNIQKDILHYSLDFMSCRMICMQLFSDQGSTPKFHINLVWQQILFRLQYLSENTHSASFNKLKIVFTHCFFKIKSACQKCINFSVTSFLLRNDSFEGEKNLLAYKT